MSTNAQNNTDDQEIDLAQISQKVGSFFSRVNTIIFKAIQFVLKNIIVIGILFIIGLGLGVYLDRTQKTYDHQIIVTPNFGSVDYLYSKINLIQSKIREGDVSFLKSIGIEDPKKLIDIDIEPITDVYGFISRNEQNFELLKLMAEDADIQKIIEDGPTSKNYPFHLILLTTKSKSSRKQTIDPLLKYLNNNNYLALVQKEYVNNIHLKMKANEQTILQIDGILNELSTSAGTGLKNSNLVYYNENSQLNDIIKTKDELVREQGAHRIELVGIDKIIKDNSATVNIENNKAVNGKLKFVLPFIFVGLYLLFRLFGDFYRGQKTLL